MFENLLYFLLGIVVTRVFQGLFMAGRIALIFYTAEFQALKLLTRAEEHIWQARTMLDMAAEVTDNTQEIKIVRNEINFNHKKWQKETADSLLECYGPFVQLAHWENWRGAINYFEREVQRRKQISRSMKNDKKE
jgi:hypothetical protein